MIDNPTLEMKECFNPCFNGSFTSTALLAKTL